MNKVATLESYLSAVRDGDPEGVHQARVSTRRIRELLPPTAKGRSLGDVRDADVQTALLRSLETRIPGAAPMLVVFRQRHERHRLALMRALIKDFEQMEIEQLLESVQHGVIHAMRHTAAGWDRRLRRAVADRAAGALAASSTLLLLRRRTA